MMKLITFLIVNSLLSVILLMLGMLLSKKTLLDREKLSPFECGFTPNKLSRTPLSLRFFLVAVIFLIFDVELVLLFPAILSMGMSMNLMTSWMIFYFIVILLAGFYYEHNQGSLNWAN